MTNASKSNNKQNPAVNKIHYFDLDLTQLTCGADFKKEKVESVQRLNKTQPY